MQKQPHIGALKSDFPFVDCKGNTEGHCPNEVCLLKGVIRLQPGGISVNGHGS